jgi:transcriptional regulator with XRE-family HTH domain
VIPPERLFSHAAERLGLEQRSIARAMGTSKAAVSRWFSGERYPRSEAQLEQLCGHLRLDVGTVKWMKLLSDEARRVGEPMSWSSIAEDRYLPKGPLGRAELAEIDPEAAQLLFSSGAEAVGDPDEQHLRLMLEKHGVVRAEVAHARHQKIPDELIRVAIASFVDGEELHRHEIRQAILDEVAEAEAFAAAHAATKRAASKGHKPDVAEIVADTRDRLEARDTKRRRADTKKFESKIAGGVLASIDRKAKAATDG